MKNTNNINAQDYNGLTLLHSADEEDYFLIVNSTDCRGETPLDWAKQGGIKVLKDAGATRKKV